MSSYRMMIEYLSDEGKREELVILDEQELHPVESILDLGLRHKDQITLVQKILDEILRFQTPLIQSETKECPRCSSKLQRSGYTNADFNSVFTDHKIKLRRLRCSGCSWRSIPSILSIFGTTQHPDLARLQCETGVVHSYRKSQDDLNRMCCGKRKVNNHDRIHQVTEAVGQYISDHLHEGTVPSVPAARELTIQTDGGHLKDKEPGKRSFEVMTSVVYQPQNIKYHADNDRGTVTSKHCAASAQDDQQAFMKQATLLAARKQGLSNKTHVTAVCDGAVNCWQVVEALEPHCGYMTRILDWFHLGMRFENIALPEEWKPKLVEIKWHLWRGNAEKALIRGPAPAGTAERVSSPAHAPAQLCGKQQGAYR